MSTQTEAAAAAEPPKASDGEGLLLCSQCSVRLMLEDHHMLILPPCVMHTYYKTKHLQTLVLLALMLPAFFLGGAGGMNGPISRVTTTKSFVQLKSSDLTPKMSLS